MCPNPKSTGTDLFQMETPPPKRRRTSYTPPPAPVKPDNYYADRLADIRYDLAQMTPLELGAFVASVIVFKQSK
jgi:hypothetical protein